MTLFLVHIWSSVAISFSGHPFHACSYMHLNHVFVVVVVFVVVLFKGVWGLIKSQFLASA